MYSMYVFVCVYVLAYEPVSLYIKQIMCRWMSEQKMSEQKQNK